MRAVKSSTSREVAAMPRAGVVAAQGGLFAERNGADYIVPATRHACDDHQAVLQDARSILDTRNAYGFVGGTPDKLVRL